MYIYKNKQIKKYDSGGRICDKNFKVKKLNIYNNLPRPVKYKKIFENNSNNKKNQVKEIKKRIYNPHRKIQSLNGFIYNNDKIETYLNQLYNIKLQNNSKGINNSKITKINYKFN